MLGLAVIIAAVIYLALLLLVTRGAYRWAKAQGFSRRKCWLTGAAGFLIVYLPVFWDHIPTLVAHRYFCSAEAGFWAHKSIDQWKSENPGIIEALSAPTSAASPTRYERSEDRTRKVTTYLVNERINWVVIQQDLFLLLPIIRVEQQVRDISRNEVLARYVDFGTGNSVRDTVGAPGPLKFWMNFHHCWGGALNEDALHSFQDRLLGVK